MLIVAAILGGWLLLGLFYVALCRVAAGNERRRVAANAPASKRELREGVPPALARGLVIWESAGQETGSEGTQRPRRSSTWSTVRSKIFMSLHKDQFATYR